MKDLFKKYNDFIKDIEIFNISEKLIELPKIIAFYQNYYFTFKDKFYKLQNEIEKKWTEKYIYYKNDFDFSLTNSEIKQFIEKDLEMLDLKYKLNQIKGILEKFEESLKNLDGIKWTLKTLVEWEKFKSGNIK